MIGRDGQHGGSLLNRDTDWLVPSNWNDDVYVGLFEINLRRCVLCDHVESSLLSHYLLTLDL